jgi:hypothetical protein
VKVFDKVVEAKDRREIKKVGLLVMLMVMMLLFMLMITMKRMMTA